LTHIDVGIRLQHPHAKVPTKGHENDACFDLYSVERDTVQPFVWEDENGVRVGSRTIVDTGIVLNIPPGWAGFIEPRSGLAMGAGVIVLAGVIDSGYQGTVKVCLASLGDTALEIMPGERIAQIHFREVPVVRFLVEATATASLRGASGFGSTGK